MDITPSTLLKLKYACFSSGTGLDNEYMIYNLELDVLIETNEIGNTFFKLIREPILFSEVCDQLEKRFGGDKNNSIQFFITALTLKYISKGLIEAVND